MKFTEVFQRIKEATEIKSMVQLAEIIGCTQPNVSKQKKEGNFPPGWAYIVGKKYGLLTEWIMTGEGPKRLSTTGEEDAGPDQRPKEIKVELENERRCHNRRIIDLLSPNLRQAVDALRRMEEKHPRSFLIMLGKILEELRNQEETEVEQGEKKVANH